MKKLQYSITVALLSLAFVKLNAEPLRIDINVKKPGSEIKKTMYGIFFEDINFGADGGLYAEKIKNRSFEFPQNLLGWTTFGKLEVCTVGAPFPNNPHYVRLIDPGHKEKRTGLDNEGFFGVSVETDAEYRFSVWARATEGASSIRVELVDEINKIIVAKKIDITSNEWQKYTIILKSLHTEYKAKLRIFLDGKQSVDLDHISMFPVDTWKGRENGLRKDLAQALFDLKPGVFRFPGGCIVEGTDLDTRYNWKNSVGPVENRKLNENRWNYSFRDRFFPDYFQTYGLGFYEFFQLSEDIGAEPLPVVSVGLSCQFQNACCDAHVSVSQLDSYVQDALDLIEFANGDITTKWGKLRTEMGHPAPFNLKLLAVGNEQWGTEYVERLAVFMKILSEKHPEIKIVGSAGPYPDGESFNFLWPEMKKLKVDLVDEHYYRPEDWFLKNANRYDLYDRKGPAVFAGEYACHAKNRKNNFQSALAEAAFMTGLERNADIVQMCTYAPLFAHVQGWQWRPDMIWFDNLKSVRSANYYVQQLYSNYVGTHVLRTECNKQPLSGQDGLFASSVLDKNAKAVYLKIANTSEQEKKVNVFFNGQKPQLRQVHSVTLHSDNKDVENTLQMPFAILPVVSDFKLNGNELTLTVPAKCFQVFDIR